MRETLRQLVRTARRRILLGPRCTRVQMVAKTRWGEDIMRGRMLAPALSACGLESSVIAFDEFSPATVISNGVVVFIKHLTPAHVELARKHNNAVVWNIVDGLGFEKIAETGLALLRAGLLDGVTFPSKAALRSHVGMLPPEVAATVLYNSWDPRWAENTASKFRLVYFGLRHRLSVELDLLHLPGLEVIEAKAPIADSEFEQLRAYSCHFTVRTEGSIASRTKPNSKLSAAAAAHANIILSRDPANTELLDESYPYYCNYDTVAATVERARDSFGTAEWREGLAMLSEVRERTSMPRITRDYLGYLSGFLR